MRRPVALVISTLVLGAAFVAGAQPTVAQNRADDTTTTSAQFLVVGPKTWADRNAIARTGAAIDLIEHGKIYITATAGEAAQIRKLGFGLEVQPVADVSAADAGIMDFPPADSNYHNYAEMNAELNQIVADHPAIAQKISIGNSYEG